MYFDTSYLAKFYLAEPESRAVREIVREADVNYTSRWAVLEFHAVLHRHVRESSITERDRTTLAKRINDHTETRLWTVVPLTETILEKTSAILLSAPRELFLRTADALHLATALHIGQREVWTNDRHMLAAAPHFDLTGRSV